MESGSGIDLFVIGGLGSSHLGSSRTLPAAQRFWDRMGSFARVILFDKRGMGLSDRDAGAYTLENVVDDALAVLDALGVAQAAIFGISEGGSAATMLAAAHPDRVSAMVPVRHLCPPRTSRQITPRASPSTSSRHSGVVSKTTGSIRRFQHRLLGSESRGRPRAPRLVGSAPSLRPQPTRCPGALGDVSACRCPSVAGECQGAVADPLPRR